MPGVARRPLTFFASPKKVSKERRPRRRCPFGVPVYAGQKMGSGRNSLRSDNTHFFFHFLPSTNGIVTVDNIHSLFVNNVVAFNSY